ncbi:MAG: trigger factor [Treponema sp.]|nr:trigger factor [Treponema sp.]
MTISKEISRLEHSAIQVTITVGKEDLNAEYDQLVADYRKTLQIPGFRKGKVPKTVLERKLGDGLKAETLSRILERAVTQVLEDPSFPEADRPLSCSTPEIQGEPKLDLGTDLVFSVFYEVLPPVSLGTWQGLVVEVPQVQITDDDINRELEIIQDRNAIIFDRADEAEAAAGDMVTIQYSELSDTGEPVPGTERQDFEFTLGSRHNRYHIDDEMLGMKRGETRDIEKTYPEDFYDTELAGKTLKIRVSLTALKEKDLPEINDDLAQDVDEKYRTLEDLKASIRSSLMEDVDRRLQASKIDKLLEKIRETTPMDLPESLIRFELERRLQNVARNMQLPLEELPNLIERKNGSFSALVEALRPEVMRELHSRLIIDALMKDRGIAISDEEMEQEYAHMAAQTETPVEEIRSYYEAQKERKDLLMEAMKDRKVHALLLAENTITTGKPLSYLDLVEHKDSNTL